jgi:hypothetical protein
MFRTTLAVDPRRGRHGGRLIPRSGVWPGGAAIALGTSIALVAMITLVGCAGVPTTTPSLPVGLAPASPSQQAVTTASPTASPGIMTDDYSTTCRPGPWPPDLPNVTGTAPADVAGAATGLVPFAPSTALLCLYIFDPDPHGIRTNRLVASRYVTSAAVADEIRARLNSAAIAEPSGWMSCPHDSGTKPRHLLPRQHRADRGRDRHLRLPGSHEWDVCCADAHRHPVSREPRAVPAGRRVTPA